MKISKILSALIFSVLISAGSAVLKKSYAQLFTGGDLNITFVGGFTADIAPIIGYKYYGLSAGVSPVLMYTATGNMAGDFSYGARVFGEYNFYKGAFVHAEFGALNTGFINWEQGGIKQRNWVLSAPVGLGYEAVISKKILFKTMVLYDALLDINLNQNSPLANPSIRGGFTYLF